MLKYKENETLTWDVDWINTTFVSDNYIALVDGIYVDGVKLTSEDYTIDRYTIELVAAPLSSISLNHFYREELDIIGNWLVEFWDLIQEVYDELGRSNLSKVYKKERIESMLNKSIKRITNKAPEKTKIQHYALKGVNWFKAEDVTSTGIGSSNIQWVGIQWALLAGDNIYLPYTDFDWTTFTTQIQDVVEIGDKIIVAHRIPYGVQKVSAVYVDSQELTYVDNKDFSMSTLTDYTIIRGKDGNEYLFLPYSETEYTLSVKYVPDQKIFVNETDVVDIEPEYTTVIVYDVLYRLAWSREDERTNFWYRELYWDGGFNPWLLKEYRSFKSNQIKRTRSKIGFAPTVKPTRTRNDDWWVPKNLY